MWDLGSFRLRSLFFLVVFFCSLSARAEICYPVQSLRSIYKSDFAMEFKVKVGLVGSGIDYNHPVLARFLAIRPKIEAQLRSVEVLPGIKNLSPCEYQKVQEERRVGFPIWMDQALGLFWPADQIFKDGKLIPNQHHETRIASRIIYGRSDVALHFARRMFGSQKDTFNALQVIKNFSDLGVQVVNMSFGSTCGALPAEEKMWSQIFKKYSQMIFVVSAGNSGQNLDYTDFCPAKFSRENANVISVTSVTPDGELSIHFDPEQGQEVLMNYGRTVDVGIRADHLSVLTPYLHEETWSSLPAGWTSLAAAEVTRVIAHAIADGYFVNPQTVKEHLIRTSRPSRSLQDFIKSSGEVNEADFRSSLKQPLARGPQ